MTIPVKNLYLNLNLNLVGLYFQLLQHLVTFAKLKLTERDEHWQDMPQLQVCEGLQHRKNWYLDKTLNNLTHTTEKDKFFTTYQSQLQEIMEKQWEKYRWSYQMPS